MPRAYDTDLIAAIGRRLRDVRLGRGMSQERLAELIPVEPETLSRAEAGARALSLSNLGNAARALHVPLAVFFQEALDDHLFVSDVSAEHDLLLVCRRLDPPHQQALVRIALELERAMAGQEELARNAARLRTGNT
jgi:hypothetical protein